MIKLLLIILILFLTIVFFYLIIRNSQVFTFRNNVLNNIPNNEYQDDYFDEYDKVSYHEMVFSLKPLKLGYWYPNLVGKINM